MAVPLSVLGKRFGKLVAVEELARERGMRRWRLRCDCGNDRIALQKAFCSGGSMKSCGCANIHHSQSHGLSKAPEYRHWINMISRCENPDTPGFENYGGRGISVCQEWRESFPRFYQDLGRRPSGRHSVDRIDVNGNYEPTNCRWATQTEQSRNTRVNHHVTIAGRGMTLAEAVEQASVPYNSVLYRLKRGWSAEDAISHPAKKGYRPHAA